ncbi:MAG: zinc-finger domain-containing protein [Hyphomonadaceae bacterium]
MPHHPEERPAPPEIIETASRRVSCDGGGGALGHPRIYMEMGDETFVECSYCDRRFVLKAGAEAQGGH